MAPWTDPVARTTLAPSAPIAKAARAFGDDYPSLRGQWRVRSAGVLLLVTTLLYVPWMLTSLNEEVRWLAWPFAAANLFSLAYGALSVFNAWRRQVPERRPLPPGDEPQVGVIIPTCGEAVPMILRTIVSVLQQDWPLDRLTVVVSDDGHDPALEAAVAGLPVLYHSPPPRFAPGRDGAAKAGNLNSAVAMLDEQHPGLRYIETRDADDEMGSTRFLREVIGQLEADDGLAFVQTIKEAQVSAGDPFNNRESMFYRGQMLARNAANAVFPCGSGVVWRRTALREIGDFPTWNLVEDLQSGVEALRRGWRRHLPADRRGSRAALAGGRPQRLQAARHVGDRHRAPHGLGQAAGAQPAPAGPLRGDAGLLPERFHGPGLHPEHHLHAARLDAA
ncbi:MAG TPA: glycosyltransferase [Candidatus Limnocylindrales bacterium]|nr:glycosyltransferase [Candidatus Limnocylindrales bacterium]